jgi:hypothetical protein
MTATYQQPKWKESTIKSRYLKERPMDSGMNDTLNSDYMTFITKASRHFSDEPTFCFIGRNKMFRLLDTCETKFNGWLADVG